MGAGNGVTCATQKDPGPVEISNYSEADIPDSSQLHNAQVEPICRKYLELRYRMLPYLYGAVRECTTTSMPVMRSLWLHYSDDSVATAREESFDYRKGKWTGIRMAWNDSRRMLSLRLASGSRFLPPLRRNIDVRLNQTTRPIVFEGHPVEVRF